MNLDTVNGLFAGVANVTVLVAMLRTMTVVFADSGLVVRLAAALTAMWALVVACGLLLGATGLLSFISLYLLVSVTAAVVCHFALNARETKTTPLRRVDESSIRLHAVLGCAYVAHLVAYGLVRLPDDWDSFAYHMPLFDHWIQGGSLYSQDCAFWYVPGNNELLAYWFNVPFSGDFWVNLNNVPSVLLLAVSLEALGQMLHLSRFFRGVVLTCTMFSQPVIRQVVSAENDVAVAALFLATLLFGWRYVARPSRRELVMFALAVGLLCGIKYYALGYAAAAATTLVLYLVKMRHFRLAFHLVASSIVGFVLLGVFWYARNWLLGGSPLYPMSILGSASPWDEMRPNVQSSTLLWSGRAAVWPMLLWSWFTQAGPVTAITAIVSPALACILLLSRRSNAATSWCVLVAVLSAAFYMVMPNVVEVVPGSFDMLRLEYPSTRFGFPFLICTLLLAALVGQRFVDHFSECRFTHASFKLALRIGVAAHVFWHVVPLLGGFSLHQAVGAAVWPRLNSSTFGILLVIFFVDAACLACLIHPYLRAPAIRIRWTVIRAIWIFVVLAYGVASGALADRWHRKFDDHFARLLNFTAHKKLEEHLKPTDRVCVCTYRYYPFLGSRREKSVCRPLWVPRRQEFELYLSRESATHVVVPINDFQPIQWYKETSKWCQENPDRYEHILSDGRFQVYRVLESNLERTTNGEISKPTTKLVGELKLNRD